VFVHNIRPTFRLLLVVITRDRASALTTFNRNA
jgi:hypothetical protein